MRIAPATDPITWLLLEQRGPNTAHGRYDLTTLQFDADADGRALLQDGSMSYPADRGVTEFFYESIPWFVREGRDPEVAVRAAREGAALLVAAVERAVDELAPFAVTPAVRLPRDPDTLELWLRRASGDRARYIVPRDAMPAAVRDAQAAANAFASTIRANFDRQDPPSDGA